MVKKILFFLFSFRGRMERSVYGLFLLSLAPLVWLRGIGGRALRDGLLEPHERWALLLFGFVLIAVLCSALARRMHDFNLRAGWALAVPLLGYFLPFAPLLFIAVLLLVPGTKGGNRFGPPPIVWRRMRADFALRRLARAYAAGKMDTAAFNAARGEVLFPANKHE